MYCAPEMVRLEFHVATVTAQQRLATDVREVGDGRSYR